MDSYLLLTVLLSLWAFLQGEPIKLESNHPAGAKAGDQVTFTCSYTALSEPLKFLDALQWGRSVSDGFELIASNGIIEPLWRSIVNATVNITQSTLTMTVRAINQTGTYSCRLRRMSCMVPTCLILSNQVPLKVYGPLLNITWQSLDDDTLTAKLDHDTIISFVTESVGDVAEYTKVYLGINEITNSLAFNSSLVPRSADRWWVRWSGHHKFMRSDDGLLLKIDVSVPLHSTVSRAVKVKVLSPPIVDCPETVPVTLGQHALISCIVTSSLPLVGVTWDGGEEMTLDTFSDQEVAGLTTSLMELQGTPGTYNVFLQTTKFEEHHFRLFKLRATNEVDTAEDSVSFSKAFVPVSSHAPVIKDRLRGAGSHRSCSAAITAAAVFFSYFAFSSRPLL